MAGLPLLAAQSIAKRGAGRRGWPSGLPGGRPFWAALAAGALLATACAARAAGPPSVAAQRGGPARLPLAGLPDSAGGSGLHRTSVGGRWEPAVVAAVANIGFDYLALLCALRRELSGAAVGRSVLGRASPTGLIRGAGGRWKPSGLAAGFVEAGLVGTLSLAGVAGAQALTATLLYRLAAYWLPIPAGGVAYLLFRRRYH